MAVKPDGRRIYSQPVDGDRRRHRHLGNHHHDHAGDDARRDVIDPGARRPHDVIDRCAPDDGVDGLAVARTSANCAELLLRRRPSRAGARRDRQVESHRTFRAHEFYRTADCRSTTLRSDPTGPSVERDFYDSPKSTRWSAAAVAPRDRHVNRSRGAMESLRSLRRCFGAVPRCGWRRRAWPSRSRCEELK